MTDLSNMLFEQGVAMNRAIASGVEAGKESSAKRIKELENALRPFVDAYIKGACPMDDSDLYDEQPRDVYVTLGDCRKAERALWKSS